ncbi:unnamed protein product [Brachionus calyciflorus]|uniref:Uncharacterized protein n=1 Tax=Brachionus calyciflorus TaxID=104777 RepID=A0A813VJT2_9BILA|nr:unnamed protein product [Brachionus calyciflorus]
MTELSIQKYEYVQSNTFKPEHDNDDNLVKDGFEVLYEGFLYAREKYHHVYVKCVMPLFSFASKKKLTNNSHENESESEDEDEDLLDSSDDEEL